MDWGMGSPHAERLSRDFGTVYYWTPWKSSFPKSNDSIVGQGMDGITRIKDYLTVIDSVDILVCLDTNFGDVVDYWRAKGKRVFGAGSKAELFELDRWKSKKITEAVKLPVPRTEYIIGLDNLRKRLNVVRNKYVKLSLFRGAIESFPHDDYKSSEPFLARLEVALGAMKNKAEFIIEDKIEGTEIGIDTFVVDGEYPNKCLIGWEKKDAAFIGKIFDYDKVIKPLREVNEKLKPFFKKTGARSMFSTEVRITKEGRGYLIDPCVRMPLPPSYVEMEIYDNYSEFIWYAAEGKIIPLKPNAVYGCEVIMGSDFSEENLLEVKIPKEIKKWVKISCGCCIDGRYYILPGEVKNHFLSVVGLGNTLNEAIGKAEEVYKKVEAFQLSKSFDFNSLREVSKEADRFGIKF